MNEPIGDDPLDQLRRANPVDPERLPSASLARVRARFQEHPMSDRVPITDRSTGRLGLALSAGAGAVAVVALVVLLLPRGAAPGLLPSPTGGPISASCVETYSLESLSRRTFAFDGTVVSFDGDEVTFDVNEAFRGVAGDQVTLTATGMTGTVISSARGPNLMPGGRYLIAGDAHFVWACGFTQDFDPAVAAQWRQAFGG